jgi:hypothetical protein
VVLTAIEGLSVLPHKDKEAPGNENKKVEPTWLDKTPSIRSSIETLYKDETHWEERRQRGCKTTVSSQVNVVKVNSSWLRRHLPPRCSIWSSLFESRSLSGPHCNRRSVCIPSKTIRKCVPHTSFEKPRFVGTLSNIIGLLLTPTKTATAELTELSSFS